MAYVVSSTSSVGVRLPGHARASTRKTNGERVRKPHSPFDEITGTIDGSKAAIV